MHLVPTMLYSQLPHIVKTPLSMTFSISQPLSAMRSSAVSPSLISVCCQTACRFLLRRILGIAEPAVGYPHSFPAMEERQWAYSLVRQGSRRPSWGSGYEFGLFTNPSMPRLCDGSCLLVLLVLATKQLPFS